MGQRTVPAAHAAPVLVSTGGHLSIDSLQLPSMHFTGHFVEQRVSCGQSSNDATHAPLGQRMGDRGGHDTAGSTHCVALTTHELSQHFVGCVAGHETLVGQVSVLMTQEPSGHLNVGCPYRSGAHSKSSRHADDDALHEPSGHLIGCDVGQVETLGQSRELCWQLPSGHKIGFLESHWFGAMHWFDDSLQLLSAQRTL